MNQTETDISIKFERLQYDFFDFVRSVYVRGSHNILAVQQFGGHHQRAKRLILG